jgi:transposase
MWNLMTWTAIARAEHNRDVLRFLECLTDREWALIAPMMPRAKKGGRPRTTDMRDVVERTFAWLGRCRRLAKDWEKSIESSTAFAHIASIRMLTRRIARYWIYA